MTVKTCEYLALGSVALWLVSFIAWLVCVFTLSMTEMWISVGLQWVFYLGYWKLTKVRKNLLMKN